MNSLTLANHISEIDRIREFLQENLEGKSLSEEIFYWIELSLVEICINIIRYAYPGGEGTFTLKIWGVENILYFEIRDEGIPFDPTLADPPDLDEIIKTRRKGGFGIYLARKLMDGFEYKRDKKQNVLLMSKKLSMKSIHS